MATPDGWTKQTEETPLSQEIAEIEAGRRPANFSPPAQIRRGSALLLLIGVVLLTLGRLILWHGPATSQFVAFLLGGVTLYTAFALVQLLFGAAINELYQSFWVIPGARKAQYLAMIVCTLALLCLFCILLFPGIGDKI